MDPVSDINIDSFRWINNLGKEWTFLNPVMAFFAEYMIYFLVLSVIVFWFTRNDRNRMMVICACAAAGVSEIIGKITGKLHSNPQPFATLPHVNKLISHTVDNSFPSDHTLLFFASCATFWLFYRKVGLLWLVLALLVGLSRIWVGVHYPADVIAGAVMGSVMAFIVYRVVPGLPIVRKGLAVYEKVEQRILPVKKRSKDFQ